MAITRHLFQLFILLLFTGLSINTYAGPVIVPNVVDTSLADATTTIEEEGLVVGNVTNANSDTIVDGNVISQDPVDGTEVAAESAVDLVISDGPAPVTVPNVTGLSLADATSALAAADLVVGTTSDQSSDTVPAGDVISQSPAGGTEVAAGSAVNLVISTGQALVTVPNVVGDSLAVATGKITAADLVVGTTTDQSSDTVTAGDVISQNPAGDTEVEAGSAVNLVISTGPASGDDTVMIGDCDTGVEDPSGNIQAGIDACEADASNHGQFVRCTAIFTRGLSSDGIISQADRRPIMNCAAQSSIGKSNISERSVGRSNISERSVGKSNISERRSTGTRSWRSRINRYR
jgi:beta-lactam-binding protein with PASTA domain